MTPNEIALEIQRLSGRSLAGISPATLLAKQIERKILRLNRYKANGQATEAGINMMEGELIELITIHDEIATIEPYCVISEIARLIKRNKAIGGIDLTVVVVPTSFPVAPYPNARVIIEDLSYNYSEAHSLYLAHMTGKACVEVDDLSGNGIDNVLKLYANRGDLYTLKENE